MNESFEGGTNGSGNGHTTFPSCASRGGVMAQGAHVSWSSGIHARQHVPNCQVMKAAIDYDPRAYHILVEI